MPTDSDSEDNTSTRSTDAGCPRSLDIGLIIRLVKVSTAVAALSRAEKYELCSGTSHLLCSPARADLGFLGLLWRTKHVQKILGHTNLRPHPIYLSCHKLLLKALAALQKVQNLTSPQLIDLSRTTTTKLFAM